MLRLIHLMVAELTREYSRILMKVMVGGHCGRHLCPCHDGEAGITRTDMWKRGGSQWPQMDAMVDAALAATTIEEQKRLIAEVDMYAIEKHWLIWAPKSPAYMLASRGS